MNTITNVDELRIRTAGWRRAGEHIALVPTMGNLHEGHLDLVRKARQRAQRVIVSIFVNPLQFGPSEDFAAYPRTLVADTDKLEREAVDLVFAPTVEDVYPGGQRLQTRVEVPGLSDILCGANRPGHFVGVATVVCKLFNMVQPDRAVFGEKDYQQLLVIRRMTVDLSMPVEIVGAATVREPGGLAISSRNGYLNSEERIRASGLYGSLKQAAEGLRGGASVAEVEGRALSELKRQGFVPDYFSVRRAADLDLPAPDEGELVILAAAYLGKARLIDNLRVTL